VVVSEGRRREVSGRLVKRLAGVLTGGLVGYIAGWIVGWNLFDPNLDVWALGALVCAPGGIALGLKPRFWRRAGIYIGGAFGLFAGWLLKALLFGEASGGWGLLLLAVGAIVGGFLGARPAFRQDGSGLRALVGALFAGFLGGFLIDAVLLDLVLGLVKEHSILSQAPCVLISGALGGFLGARLGQKRAQPSRPQMAGKPHG
jgi:hypothetical protein